MRRDGVYDAVRTHRAGTVGQHAYAELDVGIADDDRLAFQVAAAKLAQVEQRRGHDGRDDRRVEIAEAEALKLQELIEHHRIFVRGARGLRDRAPLGAGLRALADGEDDVVLPGVDSEEHG